MVNDNAIMRDEHMFIYANDLLYFFDLALYIAIYTSDKLRENFREGFNFNLIEYSTYKNCIYQYIMREDDDFFRFISDGKCDKKEVYENLDKIIENINIDDLLESIQFTDIFKGIILSLNLKRVKSVDIYIDNEDEAKIIGGILQSMNIIKINIVREIPEDYNKYTCIYYNNVKTLYKDIENKKIRNDLGIGLSLTGYNTIYSELTKKRHVGHLDLDLNIAVFSLVRDTGDYDIYG
ncbi:hypothetical protein DLH72_04520 [Candidatus Gracilibacteria bacterium]|nr:MAG: hypothetical protein DLH72_04520 [Candidatus Gracilibacteria bacterium]